MPENTGENRIPIVEERARIQKQMVPTGRVRIGSQVEERRVTCCAEAAQQPDTTSG